MPTEPATTTCCVVGGGPAGMVLALLLARGGIRVTVLEKHADFLRDFRGDTVHASTLTLLDELGLADRLAALPQRRIDRATVQLGAPPHDVRATFGDLRRLPGRHKEIAMIPQWDLLDMLAGAAAQEPGFTLIRDAEVLDLVHRPGGDRRGVVGGVRYRTPDGTVHELRAQLVVGCDGRDSVVRRAAGLVPRDFGVPLDVWWFRVPRVTDAIDGALGVINRGRMLVLLDRGDYFQCAYLIRKGADRELRRRPIGELRDELAECLPWLAGPLGTLRDWDEVKLLNVQLSRLRRWWRPGVLCIGDAAHAMSPVGGVGINLAVQDAVAAARILGPALRAAGDRQVPVPDGALRAVQRRRWLPTALTQGGQRIAHRRIIGPVLTGGAGARPELPTRPVRPPRIMRLLRRVPVLQAVPAYLVGIGVLPEHAPGWARRPAARVPAPRPAGDTTAADRPAHTRTPR